MCIQCWQKKRKKRTKDEYGNAATIQIEKLRLGFSLVLAELGFVSWLHSIRNDPILIYHRND